MEPTSDTTTAVAALGANQVPAVAEQQSSRLRGFHRRNRSIETVSDVNEPIVSIWLYIAALCVTLSGLYAVNYGREDPGFAAVTYVIAAVGYSASYTFRRLRINLDSVRLPILVLLGLSIFAWLNSGPGEVAGDARTALTDKSHATQLLCVWIALLQPFASFSDMAVLFSCVPCMSLIALVSTTSPDTEVQYAFLVFIGAATFLMVHENYLRTRSMRAVIGNSSSDRKLFAGQLQLAIVCVACAFLLANVVAVPMHVFGRSLSLANGWAQGSPFTPRTFGSQSSAMANEDQSLNIATGPVSESDTEIMRVEASQKTKWRGNTLDYYTGRSFENRLRTPHTLSTADEATDLRALRQFHQVGAADGRQYRIPENSVEPPVSSLLKPRTIIQSVTTLITGTSQCFSGGNPVSISVARDQEIVWTPSGGLFSAIPFPLKSQYRVIAVAPTDDADAIRAHCSVSKEEIPPVIARQYLQRQVTGFSENDRLRQLAGEVTAGISNSYDKAEAIRAYIARTCKYNLQAAAAPSASDRVEHFLTVSHQGYCDSFAASMTMLCRYAGIPARVATGYISGEEDGKGGYLVRSRDKHAWTEVFFAGVGWVSFDATDGSEDISDHSRHQKSDRADFLAWVMSHGVLPPLLIVALIALVFYVVWTELLPRLGGRRTIGIRSGAPLTNQAVVRAYMDACSFLSRRGLHRAKSATPSEYLDNVRLAFSDTSPPVVEHFRSLTALHDRSRYGCEAASSSEVSAAAGHAAAIRSSLARAPRTASVQLQEA